MLLATHCSDSEISYLREHCQERFNIEQIRVGHQRCSAFSLACEGGGIARTPERGRPLRIWRSYGKFFGDGSPSKGAVDCPDTQGVWNSRVSGQECPKSG